jgi:hypothetical protein
MVTQLTNAERTAWLMYPDKSEIEITPTPKLIGRMDLAVFLSGPAGINRISKGHITTYREGDKFYIEDGKTTVQNKSSANHTWLIRNSGAEDITGKGRRELKDGDEIDIAHEVKLRVRLSK